MPVDEIRDSDRIVAGENRGAQTVAARNTHRSGRDRSDRGFDRDVEVALFHVEPSVQASKELAALAGALHGPASNLIVELLEGFVKLTQNGRRRGRRPFIVID